MEKPVVAVVLAGGTGTRLYPATGPDRPKQLLQLGGDRTLLAETVDRAGFADEVYVLTRADFADDVREAVPNAAVLVEPEPKDTGPALVYAAHRIREQVGDCVLCCLPSDHRVAGEFAPTMRTATAVAADTGGLVTLGVDPDRPATGYGYIAPGEGLNGHHRVREFVEKPDAATAQEYVEAGYLWNAGMFVWTPEAFLSAARDSPLADLVESLERGEPDWGFAAVDAVSVDEAVLEDAEDVFVVPAGFDWADLGTWDAVWRAGERTAGGNVHLGNTLAVDAENCLLATDAHVSAVGVSDLVVASFDGRTLVVPREEAERVRTVVDLLRDEGRY